MLNLKCMVSRHPSKHHHPYKALLLCFVPSKEYSYEMCGGEPSMVFTQKALVKLETFSKGSILELPLNQIKLVDEYPEEET